MRTERADDELLALALDLEWRLEDALVCVSAVARFPGLEAIESDRFEAALRLSAQALALVSQTVRRLTEATSDEKKRA